MADHKCAILRVRRGLVDANCMGKQDIHDTEWVMYIIGTTGTATRIHNCIDIGNLHLSDERLILQTT